MAVLVGAPVLAVCLVALGCALPLQLLGVMCGHNAPLTLALLTVAGWIVLGVAAVLWSTARDSQ